ncbi:MAG: carbonic anhydrase [Gammaproteobacteria bacterium]
MSLKYLIRVSALSALALLWYPGLAGSASFGYFGELGPAFWGELDPAWEACGTGEIFNNGHTIEIETEGQNTLTFRGVTYDLVQFHFHTASEHRVAGRGYDMELHLVHKAGDDTNAVVAVFLKRGKSSGALASIFENLPEVGSINVKEELPQSFNPAAFLPKDRDHFRYLGSLTTPPCTEGVHWFVLTDPVKVSDEDMAQFAERIHFNARLVQRKLGH